jgi:hypothetical protein
MDGKRVAIIVSHPAHLLTVVGMQLRWKPDVLVLNRAVIGGVGQEQAIHAAFKPFGLADRLASFAISEAESFDRTLAGDFAFHASIGDRIFEWLRTVRPDVVLGDAYETYNFHHDLARLLIDDSIQRLRVLGRRIENYEFPLSCRVDEPDAVVQYGVFPFGAFRALRLNPRELTVKRELTELISRGDSFIAGVAPLFAKPEVEPYREVPADRDYTVPPARLALYYDERGREVVRAGRYAEAISFRNHFVPLVRALGLAPFVRAAA